MKLKHHFKFHIGDAKQLLIAISGAMIPWACRGFAHDAATLWYTFGGFLMGGLSSHNSTASPNVQPQSHIETPYVNNINDHSSDIPPKFQIPGTPQPEQTQQYQNVKIVPTNDGKDNISPKTM